ncbi:ARM repeat-containing protein [Epithele typhae]|uniref:ARM repeat-containing protein n=1 Tax=Epithele typhae TaxID=378194 RepID=UPI0020086016|nr:ARM repeat-containing protein [Epithele typhae]KAH9939018.1 ARM repeat-containing protein [Epithele typhae]
MTKTYIMNGLVEKMQSPDQDFRCVYGLERPAGEIKQDSSSFLGDEATENKVLKQVLALVEDKISEVKNQAVKCLGQLIKIIRESQMELVVDKLIDFSAGKDEELRDIAGLALKTITSELPTEGKIATKACEKLTPKLLHQVANSATPPETLIETLSILSILITRFPQYLANVEPQPVSVLTPILDHARPAVRKRAITTLAQFLPHSQPRLFASLLTGVISPGLASNADLGKQRTVVQLVAAVARHSPQQIAPALGDVAPSIIKDSQRDDEELRESCLQALEAFVLRCPSEVTPFLSSIIQVGNQYIKYDPNYAGGDDDEDEEMADDEDEDDEELGDEYSDDEDTSYKIRRSATKLLAAVIATRPELLTTLYKDVSPVLISRFGDREDTVRLEVWQTYGVLLNQTGVYGGSPQSNAEHTVGGKRKRAEGMEVEETPYTLLQSQVPSLAKAVLGQMKSPKTPPATLEAGFSLLHKLLSVLPGSLASQAPQIVASAKSVLATASRSNAASLQVTTMSFLGLFFSKHAPSVYAAQLDSLTPALLSALAEKHPKISSEAFRDFSALLTAMQPVKGAGWIDRVYDEALKRLSHHDTDAEVRACAEECIGDLWIAATEAMKAKSRKEWEFICRSTGRTDGAVAVVTKVSTKVEVGDDWVNGAVEWTTTLLKKSGRAGKVEAFNCLEALLRRYTAIPTDLPSSLIPVFKAYITPTDLPLLGAALDLITLLLVLAPADTFSEVERDVLPDIYNISYSPVIVGVPFESLLAFYGGLVEADLQIASHVVPNLVLAMEKAKGDVSLPNVAKCLGQVVKSHQGIAAGTISEFAKHLKPKSKAKSSQVALSLLLMGEIGRFIDMTPNQDIFGLVIEKFASDQEEVRTAAAFAAGNITVGNLHHFLPLVVKMVEHDQEKRLLALNALKEVVTHCTHGQLEMVADTLWTPLFENSENQEETTRNVAAACLGKLTTTHPGRYLPQLQARIADPNPATRATVLTAIRYTFVENARSFDETLGSVIMDFLSLISDADLMVRRLALSALNSAARSRPHLIRDHLPTLLPALYQETVVNPNLIRTVQMGPWTHKVDDGLDARKTAYETLYTLLDTCLPKLDLYEFLGRVAAGLADDSDEVKVICHMMLFRLAQVAPTAVAQRLDELTPPLEKSMKGAAVTKDTVKQDLERTAELQRSTLRAVVALSKISQPGAGPRFDAFVAATQKSTEWGIEFRELAGSAGSCAQFVGGDAAEDALPVLARLRRENKGALFVYSVEVDEAGAGGEGRGAHRRVVEETKHCIDVAAGFEEARGAGREERGTWVAIKLVSVGLSVLGARIELRARLVQSAMVEDAEALRRLSKRLVLKHAAEGSCVAFPGCPSSGDLDVLSGVDAAGTLTQEDVAALRELREDLAGICARAQAKGIRITVDAEHR